jgi:hypothetical protein
MEDLTRELQCPLYYFIFNSLNSVNWHAYACPNALVDHYSGTVQ